MNAKVMREIGTVAPIFLPDSSFSISFLISKSEGKLKKKVLFLGYSKTETKDFRFINGELRGKEIKK